MLVDPGIQYDRDAQRRKTLLYQLLKVAAGSVVVIGINAIIFGDLVIFGFCSLLVLADVVAILLGSKGHVNAGYHVMFWFHLLAFASVPFMRPEAYSCLLAYPFLITVVVFFFHHPVIRISYIGLAIIACIVNMFLLMEADARVETTFNFINLPLTSLALLSALFLTARSYTGTLLKYQRKLEEDEGLIVQKNKELQDYIDSNMQLENFAHLASHELRTPLRNMSNFAGLLHHRLEKKVNEDERQMLQFLRDQAVDMNEMIIDLLQLAQISNEPLSRQTVQVRSLLDEILDSIEMPREDAVRIETMPLSVDANRAHLMHLFRNLIENALKFMAPGEERPVRLSGSEDDDYWHFEVADRGIGISDDMKEHIFLIFKRLHANDENYQGTGIGLAICKQIVDLHGGQIWVDVNPGGGSIFKFNLRKPAA